MAHNYIEKRAAIRTNKRTPYGTLNYIIIGTPALCGGKLSKSDICLWVIPMSKWETKAYHELCRVTDRGNTGYVVKDAIKRLYELFNDEPSMILPADIVVRAEGRLMGHKLETVVAMAYDGQRATIEADRGGIDVIIGGRYPNSQIKYCGFSENVLNGSNVRSGYSLYNWVW